MRILPISLTAPLLCLAACGGNGAQEPAPASEDEAEALSEAAEMLDDPRLTQSAAPGETPGEGAESMREREGL